MRQVVYTSLPCPAFAAGWDELVGLSTARNASAGISGLLIYDGRAITQLLEGHKDDVLPLLSRIKLDSRHFHVEVKRLRVIPARQTRRAPLVALHEPVGLISMIQAVRLQLERVDDAVIQDIMLAAAARCAARERPLLSSIAAY